MNRTNHPIITIPMFIGIIAFGTGGYMYIEDWHVIDALYMTVITLAAVGYGEVHVVSDAGRIFTIFFIFMGVGCYLYLAGTLIQFLVEGRIREVLGRRKLDKQINRLKNHFIVCGYGRIGRVLSRYLIEKYLNVVVIESNPERSSALNEDGVLYLTGNATDANILRKAGIERAKCLMPSLATDADNVFLVLTARRLNPDIFIVARCIQNSTKKTLRTAGADKVVSPYDLGARRMAHTVLRPTVIHFLELAFSDEKTDIQVEEFSVKETSSMVGLTLIESGIRQKYNLIIISIKKADGDMCFNPEANTQIEAGDTLIAVGENRNLAKLDKVLHT